MKIGIDLDDVIVDYMGGFCKFYNYKHGTNFSISDFKSYHIWETIGGTRLQAISLVRKFYNSYLFDRLKLIRGAKEGVREIFNNHDSEIITARFGYFKIKTERCLKKNFKDIDLRVFYPGFFNAAEKKLRICQERGIELMIEDNKDYALKIARGGIKVLLFDRPWNRDGEIKEGNIIPVKNWNEILEKIEVLK